jgi:hypothetical protein
VIAAGERCLDNRNEVVMEHFGTWVLPDVVFLCVWLASPLAFYPSPEWVRLGDQVAYLSTMSRGSRDILLHREHEKMVFAPRSVS